MFCTACGQRNTSDSQFCANCGQQLVVPGALTYSPPASDPFPPIPIPVQQSGPAPVFYSWNVEQTRRLAAEQRSFTTPAIITLVLYFVLWIPGLIANIVYLNEARNVQRITGRAPEGKGCLWAMIIVVAILPVLGLCAWLAILAAAASSNG